MIAALTDGGEDLWYIFPMATEQCGRIKYVGITVLMLCLVLVSQVTIAQTADNACTLPKDLQQEITKQYPGRTLVNLSELGDDDKTAFQKDHGKDCPGMTEVDFYGDGEPTLALALETNGLSKVKTELVVAHKVHGIWNTRTLETTDGPTPVVWSEKPGLYTDVYGEKRIRSALPVIVFCRYEAWAILYAWKDGRVAKIWLSD